MSKRNVSMFLMLLVLVCGCVRMRDYTGTKEGVFAFGIDMKKGLGEGADSKKDYYVFEDGVNIIVGDSKNEVATKIGLPNKVDATLEKEEVWVYESKGMNLFFRGDRLDNWNFF